MTEYAVGCINHPDVSEGVRRCTRCSRPYCADCLLTIEGQPYCGDCKSEQLLDFRSGVVATLPVADLGRRFAAILVDQLPWMIAGFAFGIYAAVGGHRLNRFDPRFLAIAFTFVFYDALMLKFRGQTVGKMLVKTRVVRPDGSDITTGQAWGRAIARWALSFLYIVDWVPIFFTDERLCVHDMLAKTRVVRTD